MARLISTLQEQFTESQELERTIRINLERIGHEAEVS